MAAVVAAAISYSKFNRFYVTFTVAMYMGPILWGPGRKRSVFADCPVLVVLPWEGGKDGFHGRVLKAAAIIYYCHKMAMV